MHPLAVGLNDHINNSIDVVHREWYVGLLLNELVDLFSEMFGGILLHIELSEDDMPVIFLQLLLVLLMSYLNCIATITTFNRSKPDGNIVVIIVLWVFSNLIDSVCSCQSLVE